LELLFFTKHFKFYTLKKGLVILSGGQDSATAAFLAKAHHYDLEAITFKYGQRHSIEIELSSIIAGKIAAPQKIVDISFFPDLVESALTNMIDTIGDIDEATGFPKSFVPNRNQLFITLASAYAIKRNISTLILGVCQTDYSGYPDCRRDFIDSMERSIKLGTGKKIEIWTPLMNITKAQTFHLAHRLNVLDDIVKYTHTCYEGVRDVMYEWGYGCGKCPACQLRINGYNKFKSNVLD